MFAGGGRSARVYPGALLKGTSSVEGKKPNSTHSRCETRWKNTRLCPEPPIRAFCSSSELLSAAPSCSRGGSDAPRPPSRNVLCPPAASPNPPSVLASSTRMISFSSTAGEACRTLYTVRSSVDHASLWKTMTTLVVGRGGQRLNFWSMHLRGGVGGGWKKNK